MAIVVLATALIASPGAASGVDDVQQVLTGFDALGADRDGAGVVVAIVDSGVDLHHPMLADNLVAGWDFVDNDGVPDDPHGHGTHVAGIVAGSLGLAPAASIMPVRVLDTAGGGSQETIAAGIRWAADHGAQVINLSLGDTGRLDRIKKDGPIAVAIRDVADRAIVVAAAGNDDQYEQVFRASVPALVVVAVDDSGHPASFTNIGDARAVAAPGVNVLSTVPHAASTLFPNGSEGTARLSGTSMAAPFVSAAAAVLIQAGAVPAEVSALVQTTASPTVDPRTGAGVVDVAAAAGAVPPTPMASPSQSQYSAGAAAAPTPEPGSAAMSVEGETASNDGFIAVVIGVLVLLAAVSITVAVYAVRRR